MSQDNYGRIPLSWRPWQLLAHVTQQLLQSHRTSRLMLCLWLSTLFETLFLLRNLPRQLSPFFISFNYTVRCKFMTCQQENQLAHKIQACKYFYLYIWVLAQVKPTTIWSHPKRQTGAYLCYLDCNSTAADKIRSSPRKVSLQCFAGVVPTRTANRKGKSKREHIDMERKTYQGHKQDSGRIMLWSRNSALRTTPYG